MPLASLFITGVAVACAAAVLLLCPSAPLHTIVSSIERLFITGVAVACAAAVLLLCPSAPLHTIAGVALGFGPGFWAAFLGELRVWGGVGYV
jgi:hypothetical protein